MKNTIKNLLFYLFLTITILAHKPQSENINSTNYYLKTSVIIPCYYKHFMYIFELISDYCQQTIIPDEIVISLSEAHLVDKSEIEKLRNYNWPFKVILLTTEKKLYAGENRNIAAENCFGDIIICQDADDKPHPQRIEIIKSIFNNNKVDHLIHGYAKVESDLDNLYQENITALSKRYRLTPGNVAIKKEVFAKIKWSNYPRGQDCKFNRDVKNAGFRCQKIFLPLLWYRKDFSSKNGENKLN
jgi:cellulose synthase/poly-beta-1,6-N-acetylglucosamine synthase-like glycosyltransferase